MTSHPISYTNLNFLPNLIHDYITNSEKLNQFHQYPFNKEAFKQAVAQWKFSDLNRKTLTETLTRQYQGLTVSEKVSGNIKKLAHPNTFTITTAHQPVVFTGPLYFIYKIISAINLAEQLQKAFPDKHFVPVYCMGAEDHDFEEINHIWLNGEKLGWQHDRRGATGRIATHDMMPVIGEIEKRLQGPYAGETVELLKKSYGAHPTLADATRHLVNSLFGNDGLIVLNPDDAALKKLFAPVIEDELLYSRVSSVAEKTISALQSLGYEVQATPREINLFYLGDNFRERIVLDEVSKQYRVLNTDLSFSADEIKKQVQDHPERFSPNVMLRPLYQETILPNLAYVGGAGELSYWLEQRSIFDHYGVHYPMLILRNSAVLVDAGTQKKIEKTGLAWEELFKDEETLIKDFVKKTSTNSLDFSAEKEQVTHIFNTIKEKAAAVDVTLAGAVEAQKAAAINNVEGLEKKIMKAEKRNFETATTQIKAIKSRLFPNNELQERVDNFLQYYAEHGNELLGSLKPEFDPFRREILFVSVG